MAHAKPKSKELAYSGDEVRRRILKLAQLTEDGLTTYGELWSELFPDQPWSGQYNIGAVGRYMDAAVCFCVESDQPIVTTLIARKQKRDVSEAAVRNVYERCRELGIQVGPEPDAFFYRQRRLAKKKVA